MGSFDKAFKSKQRLHRERTNVLVKGFLERKKDYKVRATEYKRRQDIFTKLRKKTLEKNPNEFYFHMKKSHLVNGVHQEIRDDDDEEGPSPNELKLMQSQDLNYINYKRTIDLKKIDKWQSELHLIDCGEKPVNKHLFFVESDKEKKKFNVAKKMKIDPELLKMGFNFANPDAIKNVSVEDVQASNEVKELKYRRLNNRIEREKFLKTLTDRMEIKKQLLNKNQKAKKVQNGKKGKAPVYKWKTERKK
ncbi:hypothetical protein RDWZM_009208 [Blomia tropicalis]|uniref:U3 small nucleolar RNA-associated protein 11 n=1 Tax=Blomia tropicalis TaxID=40697 RepID=A0A9Q0RM41_BLOTA|nr:hypothetical protein RDWZM_009208 [Blomia tropicalis]